MKTSKSSTQVTIHMPGIIVGVDDNRVIVEIPTMDTPLLCDEGVRRLTVGLTKMDSDVLIERIAHFAVTRAFGHTSTFPGSPRGV